jgi:phospholipid/cholesterol/gamma-HCH transport system ATP-binding protein
MVRRGPIVEVENVEVGFEGKTVLRDVTFSVERGEILAILGPSGCGKSTLLKAIVGLLSPKRGTIRIGGREVGHGQTPAWVRDHIGMLFQSGALLAGSTAAENVALPIRELTSVPPPIIERLVQIKLDLVRVGDSAALSPAQLSGGMKKRVGLARAIALDPEVLFCDEPAAALDPATAREIDELLVELNRTIGITLVVVSHEIATIENISTRCLMLDPEAKGVIASGPLEDLRRSDDPRVKRFFRRGLDGRGEDRA